MKEKGMDFIFFEQDANRDQYVKGEIVSISTVIGEIQLVVMLNVPQARRRPKP